jgi:hypothetical protein
LGGERERESSGCIENIYIYTYIYGKHEERNPGLLDVRKSRWKEATKDAKPARP